MTPHSGGLYLVVATKVDFNFSDGDVYARFISPLTTGIDTEIELMPDKITLLQNFPNPFNPSTTIRYRLPEDSNVSLVIYDVRGNLIQTLETGHRSAGWYNVVWNGQTADGSTISTGIYFARLYAGDYSYMIKMLYLR